MAQCCCILHQKKEQTIAFAPCGIFVLSIFWCDTWCKMTSNYIKNAPRVGTNALLANLGEAMLMCWAKHTIAIGPALTTTQSKTDLAQSKVGFKYFDVAFVKLRFVARNGIQMLLTELANANVAVGFVCVVVGQSDVWHIAS